MSDDELLDIREDVSRSQRGASAAKTGAKYERALAEAHEVYAALGLAHLEQRPVDTSPMPKGWLNHTGQQKAGGAARILAKRAGYDFYGVLGPHAGPAGDRSRFFGLALAMEAKSTSSRKSRLPIAGDHLKKRGGGLQQHQLEALLAHTRDFGGVSAVVWNNGGRRLVLLPDRIEMAWHDFREAGKRSIPESYFEEYPVKTDVRVRARGATLARRYLHVEDWLEPILEYLEKQGAPSPSASRIPNPFGVDDERDRHTRERTSGVDD